jgi:hypothetical protein
MPMKPGCVTATAIFVPTFHGRRMNALSET